MSAVAIVCTDITAMVNAELALRKSQEERAALLVSENAARVRAPRLRHSCIELNIDLSTGSITSEDGICHIAQS